MIESFHKSGISSLFQIEIISLWIAHRIVIVVMHPLWDPEVQEDIDPIKFIAPINLINLINMQMT